MPIEEQEAIILDSEGLERCIAFATIQAEELFRPRRHHFSDYVKYRWVKSSDKVFGEKAIYNWANIGATYLQYQPFLEEIGFNSETDNLNSLLLAKSAIGDSTDENKIREIIADIPRYTCALYKKKYAPELELEEDIEKNYEKIDAFKTFFVIHESSVYRLNDIEYTTPIITFNRELWGAVEYRVVARKLLDALVNHYGPNPRDASERIKKNARKLPSEKFKL